MAQEREITKCTKKLLGVIDMFIILIVVTVSWVYNYVKTHQILHFKQAQLIVCQLYFNKYVLKRDSN